MPPRIPKPCSVRGCHQLTLERYCARHQHLGWELHQCGRSRHERGYGAEWSKLRRQVLRRDKGLCQSCRRAGRATVATEVDHIVAKARGGLDELSNLEALCQSCHRNKTALERQKGQSKTGQIR